MTPSEREALIDLVESENEAMDREWGARYHMLLELIADDGDWEELAMELAG